MMKKLGQEWVSKVTSDSSPDVGVTGGDCAPAPRLDQAEWLRRYQQRFVDVGALDVQAAREYAETETFDVLSEGFEDNPEGAADESMSYWDGD